MSSQLYEKIGRRVVEMLTVAEFAKVADKGTGGKKNKCQPQNISCGKSCISGKKTCRITMTTAQQRAAKELKKELRSKGSLETQELAETPIDQLFLEADRIGNKYQTEEEIADFEDAMSRATREIDDVIDEIFDDSNVPREAASSVATQIKIEVPKIYKKAFGIKTPEQMAASKAKLEKIRSQIDPDKELEKIKELAKAADAQEGLLAAIDRLEQLKAYAEKGIPDGKLYGALEETVRIGAMGSPASAAGFGDRIYAKLSEAQKDALAEKWHEESLGYAKPAFLANPQTSAIITGNMAKYLTDIDDRIRKIRIRDEWE